jgi:hypothetical protein
LALLAATFGFAAGCGETDDGAAQGNDAGSAGQAVGGAGGAANAGKSGGASAGSSAGTTLGGVSGSGSGGSSASAGTAGASGLLHDCDPRKVTCKIAVPDCPDLQVPSVEGTCWGDCVEIAECACSGAEDCPDNDQYTCWSQRHCGPYVR